MATENQKKAVHLTLENLRQGKKINLGDNLRKAGYSEAVATHPKEVIESKGWKELMEQYLPDDLLVKKNLELLNHKEWQAVNAGLDKAYKVKGKLIENLNAIQINIGRKSTEKLQDEELERLMEVFKDNE